MKTPSEVISFRCPVELARQVDLARRPFNISRGDWARATLLSQLQNADQRLVRDQVEEAHRQIVDLGEQMTALTEEVQTLGRNLFKTTYLLLTRSKLAEDEAKELVTRVLGTGRPKP
jgi:hypothetical protein